MQCHAFGMWQHQDWPLARERNIRMQIKCLHGSKPIEIMQLKCGLAFPHICKEYILPYAAFERVAFCSVLLTIYLKLTGSAPLLLCVG